MVIACDRIIRLWEMQGPGMFHRHEREMNFPARTERASLSADLPNEAQ